MPVVTRLTVGQYSPLHAEYQAFSITPSDSLDLPLVPGLTCVGVQVGSAGNIAATTLGGVSVSFASVPAGTILDATLRRILATGTTASNLQALYRASER